MKKNSSPTARKHTDSPRWFSWRDLVLLAVLGFLLLGAALDARALGEMTLHGDAGSLPALTLDSDVEMVVRGPVARVRLTQHFRNPTHDWMEGVYRFPMPEDAAVDGLELRIGKRVIRGEVREKREAKQVYLQARDEGKRASLVTGERPNLFTTRAANIAPGETVQVTLSYVQAATWRDGGFELRLPMTFTPRFDPGPASGAISPGLTPAGNGPPLMLLDIRLDAGVPLAELKSLHHPVRMESERGWKRITLADQVVSADRDFVLRWVPQSGRAPAAAAFSESAGGESFAMLMLVPPAPRFLDPAPREVVFVIDTSGSMHGASMAQAKQALVRGLERLGPGDRFNVIQFNSGTEGLFPQPVAADRAHVERAVRWVRALRADGGTVMRPALEAALTGRPPRPWLRQVVFITDGAVGNEAELFALIHERLGEARLFTVGIGSAPNSHFMREAAKFGRGSYTYVADTAQVEDRVAALFDKLTHPAMQDLCVQWPRGAEQHPDPLPDLYAGEPLVVFAKLDTLDGNVDVCGSRAGTDWRASAALAEGSHQAGIAKLWARQKIESLLDARVRGEPEPEVRAAVTAVALAHQLVSPYTSLVAVDHTPARTTEALKRARLANAAPAGAAVALPQTALGLPGHALLGLLGVLLALLAWHPVFRRPPPEPTGRATKAEPGRFRSTGR